ncbi:hypothetical protein C8J57DRAFT_1645389 [Mycena rebaudengoi]|nr:hypothetical protein C8J57DRAFT_1645389 [Mycena rebaudengoi]
MGTQNGEDTRCPRDIRRIYPSIMHLWLMHAPQSGCRPARTQVADGAPTLDAHAHAHDGQPPRAVAQRPRIDISTGRRRRNRHKVADGAPTPIAHARNTQYPRAVVARCRRRHIDSNASASSTQADKARPGARGGTTGGEGASKEGAGGRWGGARRREVADAVTTRVDWEGRRAERGGNGREGRDCATSGDGTRASSGRVSNKADDAGRLGGRKGGVKRRGAEERRNRCGGSAKRAGERRWRWGGG